MDDEIRTYNPPPPEYACRLDAVEGERAGESFRVVGEATIGRGRTVDVVLEHETVSRRHARVVARPDGALVVDLKSTSGTFVDDRQVSGTEQAGIGARIRVGRTTFVLAR